MNGEAGEMATSPEPFGGAQAFLFNAPLYAPFKLDSRQEALLIRRVDIRVDGHCVDCPGQSTFSRRGAAYTKDVEWLRRSDASFAILDFQCARDPSHVIQFHLWMVDGIIQKIGQYPSFADIAVDESKAYRPVLSSVDAFELNRAIGLAAHGVGIGSFVYLRRIFERLIHRRFDEFKAQEEWTDKDFEQRRMDERIELLADHLPQFLVKNKKLYGILSRGIHELDEQECLSFFEVMRASTVIILDEDKRKKEEKAQQEKLKKAIAAYAPPKRSK
jgi:hypothetical protein